VLGLCQVIRPVPRLCVVIRNKYWVLRGMVVSPRSTPRLEDHPLSAVCDCLFNIFAATLHIWRPSPLSATRGRAMPWWQRTHVTWLQLSHCRQRSRHVLELAFSFVPSCTYFQIKLISFPVISFSCTIVTAVLHLPWTIGLRILFFFANSNSENI
jgi:hypothetical protein